MPASGIAFFAFVLALVVLIGGPVWELRNLNRDKSLKHDKHNY